MTIAAEAKQEYLDLLEQKHNLKKYNFIKTLFPDEGKYSRDKYKKHIEFLNAGKNYLQRGFIAGNQVGKTLTGCYEDVCHATGIYPEWWEGKRFDKAVKIWICGDRGEAIRDSIQVKLLGDDISDPGTGLLPKDCIVKLSQLPGIPNAVGQYQVKHISGGVSTITIKTYQSGRTAFEAAVVDVIHLDEECPRDIFAECMTRIINTKGVVFLTFTPDSGLTDTVQYFLSKENEENKFVVKVGWDDVPHIDAERKKILLATYTPQERECRSKGIPYLGKGKIYGTLEENFLIEPFDLPRHWPRCYALDVGYGHSTAAIWAAWDRESDVLYFYSEYKKAEAEVSTHANAILARGKWIPGVIDTSSKTKGQNDGQRLVDIYERFGVRCDFVSKGKGSVEEGILEVIDRLDSGRLKVFRTLVEFLDEYRVYRRGDNGQIVKENDDLMDAARYLVHCALDFAICKPGNTEYTHHDDQQRNTHTGY